MHVAESEKAAIESNAYRSAIWYVASVPRIYGISRDLFFQTVRGNIDPRSKFVWDQVDDAPLTEDQLDDENPAVALIKQELAGHEITNEAVFEAVRDIDSVVIGDVDTCRRKTAKFKEAGFDRLLCMQQYGELSHQEILKSTARLGAEIVPYFAEQA